VEGAIGETSSTCNASSLANFACAFPRIENTRTRCGLLSRAQSRWLARVCDGTGEPGVSCRAAQPHERQTIGRGEPPRGGASWSRYTPAPDAPPGGWKGPPSCLLRSGAGVHRRETTTAPLRMPRLAQGPSRAVARTSPSWSPRFSRQSYKCDQPHNCDPKSDRDENLLEHPLCARNEKAEHPQARCILRSGRFATTSAASQSR